MMTGKAKGFTLVELMVTLAVLAIVVTIGYPMYTQQVQKARRADARSALMELAMAQEREYARYGHYSEPAAGSGGADGTPAPDAASSFLADAGRIINQHNSHYNFVITADNTTYTITATTAGGQTDDTDCASFTIDQAGVKTATDTDLCW